MVATRNSGTATVESVSTLSVRSSSEPRNIAEAMPMNNATGTDTSAVKPASTSEFGRRVVIRLLTGRLFDSDVPKLPVTTCTSHAK